MATTTVDVTAAPAKILSVTELKNGNVYVVTEGKIYQLMDGKLRPLTFADVEHTAVTAGSTPTPIGAVPSAAPPPVAPPKPVDVPKPAPAPTAAPSIFSPAAPTPPAGTP
jgi:hypothetical protein